MNIYIDFSVFTKESGAYGNVSGNLDMPITPQNGDLISFSFPDKSGLSIPDGFSGCLEVMNRLIPIGNSKQVQLSLSEVTLLTDADASALMEYMEQAFDLFVDIY